MTDVSGGSSASSSSASTQAPQPARSYDTRSPSDQGDAFDAALRDAGGDRDEVQSRRNDDRSEEPDWKKRSKGDDDEADTGAMAGGLAAGAKGAAAPLASRKASSDASGRFDILGGLSQHAAATAEPESTSTDGVDLDAFAQMLDAAASRLDPATAQQTLKVMFNDAGSALQSVEVSRAPDGTISLSLAASNDAVPEVSKSLEALRRRLEAKGLSIGDLSLTGDDGAAGVVNAQAG